MPLITYLFSRAILSSFPNHINIICKGYSIRIIQFAKLGIEVQSSYIKSIAQRQFCRVKLTLKYNVLIESWNEFHISRVIWITKTVIVCLRCIDSSPQNKIGLQLVETRYKVIPICGGEPNLPNKMFKPLNVYASGVYFLYEWPANKWNCVNGIAFWIYCYYCDFIKFLNRCTWF